MPRKPTQEADKNLETKTRSKAAGWFTALLDGNESAFSAELKQELDGIISQHALQDYAVLFLHDDADSITTYHSNGLYRAAKAIDKHKVLLIIQSSGGKVEPAYLISKTLKRLFPEGFAVAVPRRAKSAATLISLGADQIHMGQISELGPIDPQIGDMPALALGNGLEFVTELVERFPSSGEMIAKYVSEQAPLRLLGYFKRVSESASQYAERLLNGKNLGKNMTPALVSDRLVNHYKDHSFVIDWEEATELLGDMICVDTPEYKLADDIYEKINTAGFLAGMQGYDFWIVGTSADIHLRKRSK